MPINSWKRYDSPRHECIEKTTLHSYRDAEYGWYERVKGMKESCYRHSVGNAMSDIDDPVDKFSSPGVRVTEFSF